MTEDELQRELKFTMELTLVKKALENIVENMETVRLREGQRRILYEIKYLTDVISTMGQ